MNASLQLDLEETLRSIVREEVERAIAVQHGGSGFLHVPQAAEFLGISIEALRGLIKRRAVPFHKQAGRIYLDAAELRAWVEGGEEGAALVPFRLKRAGSPANDVQLSARFSEPPYAP